MKNAHELIHERLYGVSILLYSFHTHLQRVNSF